MIPVHSRAEAAMPVSPMIEITYCRLCGWGLRAGWMAQELATPSELTHLKRWLIAAMPEDRSYDKRIAQISDRLNLITEPPSISITLLLDNSGSMGARKL